MTVGWRVHTAGTGPRTRDEVSRLKTDLRDIDVLVREVLQNSLDAWNGGEDTLVEVRMRIRTLTGERKAKFLAALESDVYRGEALRSREYQLRLAAKSDGNKKVDAVIDEATLHALDPNDPSHPLTLLYIDDYGTTGLTGDELDNEAASRFCACCRDAEFSVKKHRMSGGSYGKGKNVLWHHAKSRLVLFYSWLTQPFNGDHTRFIGVGKLPWHADKNAKEEAGRYSGRCELGRDQSGFSLTGAAASDVAHRLGFERRTRAGTGICLVGFDPHLQLDREAIAEEIKCIAETYYWPAILRGRISVEVLDEGTSELHTALPDERPELRPYAHAYLAAAEGGDGAFRVAHVKVPRRDSGEQDAEARMTVGCTLLDHSTSAEPPTDCVALVRGFGMVVNYLPIRPQRINASPYAAVCLAGVSDPTATEGTEGAPSAAERMESLLAYSEPEAHDRWSSREFQDVNWRGAKTALDKVHSHIRSMISDMAGGAEQAKDGTSMPELSKRFRLKGAPDASPRSLSIRQLKPSALGDDGRVRFLVQIDRLAAAGPRPTGIRIRLQAMLLDGVSGAQLAREPLPIDEVLANGRRSSVTQKGAFGYVEVIGAELDLPLVLDIAAGPVVGSETGVHYGLSVSAEPRADEEDA